MRQWSGGLLFDNEIALTGTSRRQKTLPRILHKCQDENIYEPFAIMHKLPEPHGNQRTYVSTQTELSKCVYCYEDRYLFNRIISNTDLLFDSHFEGGNLSQAFRRDTKLSNYSEYDLTLSHDVHSIGHTQWFYFSVSNTMAGLTVKFNIGTFSKTTSLFNSGMRPLLYSTKKGKWCRCGENIRYLQPKARKLKKRSCYILTFTHKFENTNDKCFFAYSYPYTYSDLQDYLRSLQMEKTKCHTFRRSLLTRTLAGNRCDLLTITEQTQRLSDLKERKGIMISSRVHPGESVASWICKGIIDFLTSDCEDARALRKAFVFKVIPMLNPDGVINGNYRTSLSGVDLNRRWNKPHKLHHPTIFKTKKLVKKFQKTREILCSCDIHGHSRREGLFMYGCPTRYSSTLQPNGLNIDPDTIPQLFDNQCEFFSKKRCTFRVQDCKASTMRIVMNQELLIQSSYTLEASLSGYEGFHFSIHDLQKMGKDFCVSLLKLHEHLTMQVKCNLDAPLYSSSENISCHHNHDVKKKSKLKYQISLCSNGSHNVQSTEDYSAGSESNPSEDNMSESEAMELLAHARHLLRKKKKKKKHQSARKKTAKNKSSKKKTKKEMCPIKVVQIGNSQLSEDRKDGKKSSST